jgi:dynamin 1-like protein
VGKLNSILHEHIKICIPDLQDKICRLLEENQKELISLGCVDLSPKEMILNIINDVTKRFGDILRGNCDVSSKELIGGARLYYTFHSHFTKFINDLSPLEGVKDEQIRTMLYNSSGSSSMLLFAQPAFERLVKNSIQILKPHSLKLVSIVLDEMIKIIYQMSSSPVLRRFPALSGKIVNSLITLFRKRSEETHKLIRTLIEWNEKYINTRHPDFINWNDVIAREMEKNELSSELKEERMGFFGAKSKEKKIRFDSPPSVLKIGGQLSEQEVIEIGIIKSLVVSYFEIVKKIVVDQVPKAIMTELVIKSEESLQETLFKEVYEASGIETLVSESSETVERRRMIERSIKALHQAYDIMCSI